MRSSTSRLFAVAIVTAVLIAAAGLGWEAARFGWTEAAAAHRLQQQVRASVTARARAVQTLAARVADEGTLVASAADSSDRAGTLFTRLTALAHHSGFQELSATVYVSAGSPGAYRVLAWSDGPAEDLTADRLAGGVSLFVAQGTAGLRLVSTQPIDVAGRRIGVAAAETVLSPLAHVGAVTADYELPTSFGPVAVTPTFGQRETPGSPDSFVVTSETGAALLEVHASAGDLAAEQRVLRRRTLGLAGVPLVLAVLLVVARAVARRRRARPRRVLGPWELAAAANVVGGAAVLIWLATLADAPTGVSQLIGSFAALGLATLLPVAWWWRQPARASRRAAVVRFAAEHLLTGLGVAALLLVSSWVLRDRITASLDRWQAPLFPLDPSGLLYLAGLMLLQIAIYWAAATWLAAMAIRWRVSWRQPDAAVPAMGLWLAPIVVLLLVRHPLQPLPQAGFAVAAGAAVVFALWSPSLRGWFRRTSQGKRLAVFFAALFLPSVVLYPSAVFYAGQAAHDLIEQTYAPETAGHLGELARELAEAQTEIDHIPQAGLPLGPSMREPGAAVPSLPAYGVWRRTVLSRRRATSSIELYGPDRQLASRFALNIPEYRTVNQARVWLGSSCDWEVFGETAQFGAEERNMLHAERGVCDETGEFRGAIEIDVVVDYRALPFVSTANPYYDILRPADSTLRGPRVNDLQVVVYGWSFHPIFTSGTVAWPLPMALTDRLVGSRDTFWMTLESDDGRYAVHFSSDRSHVYALGYREATLFEHLTRLAEAATVSAALFLLLLVGATIYGSVGERRPAPLRNLLHEVRTSFYRKLFLLFVLAAIGPVVLLAFAFGGYMTARFREDVKSEATSVVTVARRVLEELVVVQAQPNQPEAALTDDVMVWIGQVLHQDVNLYNGSELVATSQRDLFASGLLPRRTPAAVYQAIALDRLPTYVAEDRLGAVRVPRGGGARPGPRRRADRAARAPAARNRGRDQRAVPRRARGRRVRHPDRSRSRRLDCGPRVGSGRAADARHPADRRRQSGRPDRREHRRRAAAARR